MAEVNRRWSPYNYVLNNPVRLIDPDGKMDNLTLKQAENLELELARAAGIAAAKRTLKNGMGAGASDNEPPINLFKGVEGTNSKFYQLAENQPYTVGDGIFYVFGHANTAYLQYADKNGKTSFTTTPEEANALLIASSPEYKKAMAAGKKITVIFYGCQLGAIGVFDKQGKYVSRTPLAETFSEKYPNITVIAANGSVGVDRAKDGKPFIIGIDAARTSGAWVTYRQGKVIHTEKFSPGKAPTIVK